MIYGYLRVSTEAQTVESQKIGVVDYCQKRGLNVETWIEEQASGVKEIRKRKIGGWLPRMVRGDELIVAELSRLGRTSAEVISVIDHLVKRGIRIHMVKQAMVLGAGKDNNPMADMMAKMFVCVSACFAEMERELLRARVSEGQRRKRATGWVPVVKGSHYKCKRTKYEEQVREAFGKGLTVAKVAKKFRVSTWAVRDWLKVWEEEGRPVSRTA